MYLSHSMNIRISAAYEKLFSRIPNHVVTFQHNRQIPSLSVEECARRCVLELDFRCRGFDYEVQQRNCWLTELTPAHSDGVVIHPGTDFYERKECKQNKIFDSFESPCMTKANFSLMLAILVDPLCNHMQHI